MQELFGGSQCRTQKKKKMIGGKKSKRKYKGGNNNQQITIDSEDILNYGLPQQIKSQSGGSQNTFIQHITKLFVELL